MLVPVQIEVPWELDQLAKMAYSKIWEYLTQNGLCAAIRKDVYIMKQILPDPAEFGNLLL